MAEGGEDEVELLLTPVSAMAISPGDLRRRSKREYASPTAREGEVWYCTDPVQLSLVPRPLPFLIECACRGGDLDDGPGPWRTVGISIC